VLYIDDLDRCPPRRVVEVLEAVHLMLALDLFVVVVAVDARWLIRSLEYHHRELFKGGGDAESVATPIDYLDKIFQIPFTLRPPAPEATADFLRSLLPQPAPAPARRTSARPGQGADADMGGAGDAGGADLPEPQARDEAAGAPSPPPGPATAPLTAGDLSVAEITAPAPGQRSRQPESGNGAPGRRGTAPGTELPAAGGAGQVELRPLGLQVSQAEVEFMARLGGLLPTPRVAKRLVNLYRLVRIGVRSGELAEFVGDEGGGPYQAVQVLLALLVGHPEFAKEVFRIILDSAGEGAGEAGEGVGDRGYADLVAVVEAAGARGGKPHSFGIVQAFLVKIREEAPAAVSMAECRRWCPRLARFSFYTRELAGDASRGLSPRGCRCGPCARGPGPGCAGGAR
jgi:hypothetical protein